MANIAHHQAELTNKCSNCGFCYEYCPIFTAMGGEDNGKGWLEQRRSFFQSDYLLSSCLQCRACYPSCYNGVRTSEMVRRGREAVVSAQGQRHFKKMLFNHVLPHPGRVRSLLQGFSVLKKTGGISLANRLKLTGEEVSVADALLDFDVESAIRQTPMPRARDRAVLQPVVHFRSCGFSAVLPCVGMTTRALLQALGHSVIEGENACCGLPPYEHGDTKAAMRLARKNIDLLSCRETILTECASCSSFLKSYEGLFSDDEEYAKKARKLSERVIDTNVFLASRLARIAQKATAGGAERFVTFHDPCHLSRYQDILDQPRDIIKALPGIEYVELPESDRCCGGGAYSVTNRVTSLKILDRKIEHVQETGAHILATSCPACMVRLAYGVKRAGLNVTVMHLNQLIAGCMVKEKEPNQAL